MGVVDVRDVAAAHIAAAYLPHAEGRTIVCGHSTTLSEICKFLPDKSTGSPEPASIRLPALALLAPSNEELGKTAFYFDNSKSKKRLGMQYRSLKDSMHDMYPGVVTVADVEPAKKMLGRRQRVVPAIL